MHVSTSLAGPLSRMSLLHTSPVNLHHFVHTILRTDVETLRQFVVAPTRCLAASGPSGRRRPCPNSVKGNPQPVRYILDNPDASLFVHSHLLDRLAGAGFCGFHGRYVKDLAKKCRELQHDERLVSDGICNREDLPFYKEEERKRENRKLGIQAFSAVACVYIWMSVPTFLLLLAHSAARHLLTLLFVLVLLATCVLSPDWAAFCLSLVRLFSAWLDVARRRRSIGVPGDAPDAYAYFESNVLSCRFAIIRTYSGLHLTFRRRVPLSCQRVEWICVSGI